ncbi:MAG: hypothetical protein JWN65_4223, partial [Solirubrobacterales bacterium]|nr:hypothetical protein [Solirubrobacterales bacterium]
MPLSKEPSAGSVAIETAIGRLSMAVRAEPKDAPANALGIRRIMFTVEGIDAVAARASRYGALERCVSCRPQVGLRTLPGEALREQGFFLPRPPDGEPHDPRSTG